MGAGGYRLGAGRPGWHTKAEACLRLDVRTFARQGLLRSGSFVWAWTNNTTGEQTASLGVAVSPEAIELQYTAGDTHIRQPIRIDRTRCNFGGLRPWFACPRCNRRVALVYLRSGRFACRQCWRLVYSSQSEDALGRSWRAQRKLEARLGDDWDRPKGMHEATRKRIVDRIVHCEAAREMVFASYLFGLSQRGR